MALIDIWKKDPAQLESKSLQQILAFAGDGKLKDDNMTSKEFREFLTVVPSDLLKRYANDCLEAKGFSDSGLALQELVNQTGRRLGFQVEHGRYRGSPNAIGFDGLWRSRQAEAIIVEVKTTDAYRMSLDIAANYRKQLIANGSVQENKSSILYIVGRDDTGDLEAQVRGSRHAWDVRLISIDALFSLLRIKEELEDPSTVNKIRDILTPREFTRVDGIIDLVFSATKEARKDLIDLTTAEDPISADIKQKGIPGFRDACIKILEKHFKDSLLKQTPAIFATSDERLAVLCVTSRKYENSKNAGYWFAFHPGQRDTLSGFNDAWVSFACGSEKQILLFPYKELIPLLEQMHITEDESRFYWHVRVRVTNNRWELLTKAGFKNIDVTKYLMK